jgi:hypothetical protein
MQNIIVLGDITAAIVGGGWSHAFGTGKVGTSALRAFAVSIFARLISDNSSGLPVFDGAQKSQILIFLAGAINGHLYHQGHMLRYGLSQSAIDLIADELTRMLKTDPNRSLYTMGANTTTTVGQI